MALGLEGWCHGIVERCFLVTGMTCLFVLVGVAILWV